MGLPEARQFLSLLEARAHVLEQHTGKLLVDHAEHGSAQAEHEAKAQAEDIVRLRAVGEVFQDYAEKDEHFYTLRLIET